MAIVEVDPQGRRNVSAICCRWAWSGAPPCRGAGGGASRRRWPISAASAAEGALVDGGIHAGWALALIDAIATGQATAVPRRRPGGVPRDLDFRRTPVPEGPGDPPARRRAIEQLDAVQDYGVLKLYRRLQAGLHPEIEMGRFLVERAGFADTPPLLATIERIDPDGAVDGARRPVRLCRQPGRWLDLCPGLSDARVPGTLGRRRCRSTGRCPDPAERSARLFPRPGRPAGLADRGTASRPVPVGQDRPGVRAGADHGGRSGGMARRSQGQRRDDARTAGHAHRPRPIRRSSNSSTWATSCSPGSRSRAVSRSAR